MARLGRSLSSIVWFCIYIIATPIIFAIVPFYLLWLLTDALMDDVPFNIIMNRYRSKQ